MWWHTVNTDKPPPSGRWEATETYSLQKPRAFPQWESTLVWTQSASSFDLDMIEKPDVGTGPARRHRAHSHSVHEGPRPRTASSVPKSPGAQSVMKMQSPTAKLGGQRPGSAPTLLRSSGPPARDSMNAAGEPNEKDVFRQRLEDTAVADTIGKWRFEADIKKKQFKDMDVSDTYDLSNLLLMHNGAQRAISERNAKRPGSSHSAPEPRSSPASRALQPEPKWQDCSSTERVRSLARELNRSMPGTLRKKMKVPERHSVVVKEKEKAAKAPNTAALMLGESFRKSKAAILPQGFDFD